ncbi:hypothetical protein KKB10_00355 [Patescibacteria group bacterium]|nr:hypothetical protein [Patescibacteria group bacterium]MBU1075186.1 hypothetical protein [Patescibacteria group bacterium]MBU1951980.1 hypothetical protein [Patescibacteria group bacterium]
MKAGKISVGIILVAIAVWIFVTIEDTTVKYFGGIVLAVLGLIVFFMGFKKETKEAPAPPKPMEPDEHNPDQVMDDGHDHKSDNSDDHSHEHDSEHQH